MPFSYTLVFDTETTGLPPYKKLERGKMVATPEKYLKHWDECRMVEIAWLLYDNETLVKKESYVIQPDNYTVPESASRIHGITTEVAARDGRPIHEILPLFLQDLSLTETIVAHNMEFDYNVLLSELLRAGLDTTSLTSKNKICTMKDFLDNPVTDRWPRLTHLYKKHTGKEFNQEHRALGDATACAEIYLSLMRGRVGQ